MNPLKVLLMFEVDGPSGTDAEFIELMESDDKWYSEGHVRAALLENGHEVHLGPIYKEAREVIDLVENVRPDLVWNCVETFHGHRYYESNVAAILELLRVPYTGCGYRCLMICQDKALSKKILKHHRVHVPPFVTSRRSQPIKRLRGIEFPVIVKLLAEEGSVGITKDSFAEDEEQALKRAAFLHERFSQDVIVEQFIRGRELYVGVMGEQRLRVFPPREMRFANVPDGEPKYATWTAKWDPDYRERWGIFNTYAEDLSEKILREIGRVSRRVFRVLQMRGFGRIDMRLTEEGKLYVMEANPNPEIAMYEDFAEGARKVGISYNDLIGRIMRMALRVPFP
jgi:D-alanine-D-alanine ligase